MRLHSIKLKNFRSYQEEIEVPLSNMNIVLGKNDVGKSTILEGLDIFFYNGKGGTIKADSKDININVLDGEGSFEITCVFEYEDFEIVFDASYNSNLRDEYLLNVDEKIEIRKRISFPNGKLKVQTFLVSKHPINDDFVRNIHSKKITDLKNYISEHNIAFDGNRSICADLRRGIFEYFGENLEFEEILVPLDTDDGKKIGEELERRMPVYQLFQSDRSNSDKDDEVQNPMDVALNTVLKEERVLEKFGEIFICVFERLQEVATGTLAKLKTINQDLASELRPNLPSPDNLSWNKAFPDVGIDSDEIPINKRGSGVKRLILLAFFLNEVERRQTENDISNVIYAFEEPETSQHPEHQDILIKAFKALSEGNGVQVLLTTHSPYVYKNCIDDENILLIGIIDNENRKEIMDIKSSIKHFPFSPTWGEINYFIYDLVTVEFFNELYSRLEEVKGGLGVDDFIHTRNPNIEINKEWIRANNDGTQRFRDDGTPRIDTLTYITCLRHKIHHPNNNLNVEFNDSLDTKISQAIVDMLSILDNLE